MPAKTAKSSSRSKTASKTTSKKKSAAKKAPAKKAPAKQSNRMLIFCAIVLFWALAVITIFHLGAAGKVLYGLLSFIMGSFTTLVLIAGIVWSVLYIWNNGKKVCENRVFFGFGLIGLAWCMAFCLPALQVQDSFAAWKTLIQSASLIVTGAQTTWYGLIGAGLGGICMALFARAGSWIMTAALFAIGTGLCLWDQIRQWWLEFQSRAPKTDTFADQPKKKKFSWLKPLFEEEDEDDFVDVQVGPLTDPLQNTGQTPGFSSGLSLAGSGNDAAGTGLSDLQLFDQDLRPGSSLKAEPFSFEKASLLLDAEPDPLTPPEPGTFQVVLHTETEPPKSGRLFGKNFLEPVSKKLGLSKAKKQTTKISGFGLEADGPASSTSLDVSIPSLSGSSTQNFENIPLQTNTITSGLGITADDISPVHIEEVQPDPAKIAGTRMDFLEAGSPVQAKSKAKKPDFASSEPDDGLDLGLIASKSSTGSSSSAYSSAGSSASVDPASMANLSKDAQTAKEAMQDLQALPGKTTEAISRARYKPEEEQEASSKKKQLPAASSTDLSKYKLPKINLLNDPGRLAPNNANVIQARTDGAKLISILNEFGVKAELNDVHIGPSVTKFEITPGTGVRVNSITNLQNDIKMALAATDIRIEAPIPGKSAVGIEVPNVEKTEVSMRDLLRTLPKKYANLPLVFALGKDLLGDNVYGRLDTMPHLLIAGATGSGKSVCVNAIISSILMRTRPDEVKLILVDPKKVEFTPYNGVPHLLAPVITDGDLANKALQVVVAMMDRRYDLFEETMVRNITAYNAYVDQNQDSHYEKLPRIVVIIDELADLMLAAAKEVEQSIQRITQLARAAGIHLIVATQRPSVNVITGVIKANIPSRIAFAVSSTVDSRTILDQAGAERLLGYGDMLFLDNGDSAPRRIQGVYIKDEEVMRIAEYVKSQAAPMYDDAFITLKDLQSQGGTAAPQDIDPLYEEVKHFVITSRKASTSLIQRRFSIGYARAARLVDSLEYNGVVGPANGSKPREILAASKYDPDDLDY